MYPVQSVTSPWEESKAGAGKYTLVFFHNRLEFALNSHLEDSLLRPQRNLGRKPQGTSWLDLSYFGSLMDYSWIQLHLILLQKNRERIQLSVLSSWLPYQMHRPVLSLPHRTATLLCSGMIYNFAGCSEKFPCLI